MLIHETEPVSHAHFVLFTFLLSLLFIWFFSGQTTDEYDFLASHTESDLLFISNPDSCQHLIDIRHKQGNQILGHMQSIIHTSHRVVFVIYFLRLLYITLFSVNIRCTTISPSILCFNHCAGMWKLYLSYSLPYRVLASTYSYNLSFTDNIFFFYEKTDKYLLC